MMIHPTLDAVEFECGLCPELIVDQVNMSCFFYLVRASHLNVLQNTNAADHGNNGSKVVFPRRDIQTMKKKKFQDIIS